LAPHPQDRNLGLNPTHLDRALIGRSAGPRTNIVHTLCMSYHVGAKEQHQSQSMFMRIRVCLLLPLVFVLTSALISAPALYAADFAVTMTDKNYLDTQGFSVFLYDSTYHPVFVDQKNTAMEMILHGHRIATNGDVRLMPTPEQWDLVATLEERHADKANSRLT